MERLKISTKTLLVHVAVDDIVYVKADGNYCDLVLINGRSHKMTFQLHYFEEKFKLLRHHADWFIRVGRSLIVNKEYVQMIDLVEQTISFGGKHLVRPPKSDNLHWRPGQDEGNSPNKDIFTVNVTKDALKILKEQLHKIKEEGKNEQ
jgi:hypothetical protein